MLLHDIEVRFHKKYLLLAFGADIFLLLFFLSADFLSKNWVCSILYLRERFELISLLTILIFACWSREWRISRNNSNEQSDKTLSLVPFHWSIIHSQWSRCRINPSVHDWIKKIWYPVLGTWLSDHSAYHTWGPWLRSPEHTYMPGRHGRLPLFLALQGGEGNPLSKLASYTRFISELWVWLRYLHTHLQRDVLLLFQCCSFT